VKDLPLKSDNLTAETDAAANAHGGIKVSCHYHATQQVCQGRPVLLGKLHQVDGKPHSPLVLKGLHLIVPGRHRPDNVKGEKCSPSSLSLLQILNGIAGHLFFADNDVLESRAKGHLNGLSILRRNSKQLGHRALYPGQISIAILLGQEHRPDPTVIALIALFHLLEEGKP